MLFALAGGRLTIASTTSTTRSMQIGPRVVIPMHYRTPSLRYRVGPVEDFLAHRAGDHVVYGGTTVEIDAAGLPDELTVQVMRPSHDPLVAG